MTALVDSNACLRKRVEDRLDRPTILNPFLLLKEELLGVLCPRRGVGEDPKGLDRMGGIPLIDLLEKPVPHHSTGLEKTGGHGSHNPQARIFNKNSERYPGNVLRPEGQEIEDFRNYYSYKKYQVPVPYRYF